MLILHSAHCAQCKLGTAGRRLKSISMASLHLFLLQIHKVEMLKGTAITVMNMMTIISRIGGIDSTRVQMCSPDNLKLISSLIDVWPTTDIYQMQN